MQIWQDPGHIRHLHPRAPGMLEYTVLINQPWRVCSAESVSVLGSPYTDGSLVGKKENINSLNGLHCLFNTRPTNLRQTPEQHASLQLKLFFDNY